MHKILIPVPVADNLSNTDTFFTLPDHGVVSLTGSEAMSFAQAQFCNDLGSLAPGTWQWNALLTAKGRVIAVFALLHPAEGEVLLVVPDYPAEVLAAQLSRFVFRRKVKVATRSDLAVQGSFSAAAGVDGALLASHEGAIWANFGSASQPRSLCISSTSVAADESLHQRWFAYDLAHGLPRLPESQREQWTPQQLSLERLPAFSVKKGCYPGQEIVARTHFLGKAKRGLTLVRANGMLKVGDEIRHEAGEGGKIISATQNAPHLALAVLPLERSAGPLLADGVALEELPLQSGLMR